MPTPIQDEPESTIGRKPEGLHSSERPEPEQPQPEQPEPGHPARSGAALRREEGDESEAAGEIGEREQDEPPPVVGLDE